MYNLLCLQPAWGGLHALNLQYNKSSQKIKGAILKIWLAKKETRLEELKGSWKVELYKYCKQECLLIQYIQDDSKLIYNSNLKLLNRKWEASAQPLFAFDDGNGHENLQKLIAELEVTAHVSLCANDLVSEPVVFSEPICCCSRYWGPLASCIVQ